MARPKDLHEPSPYSMSQGMMFPLLVMLIPRRLSNQLPTTLPALTPMASHYLE